MPQHKTRKLEGALLGEVARALGVSRTTVWARVIRGDIKAQNLGGRFVVSRRVLRRLLAEKERARTEVA